MFGLPYLFLGAFVLATSLASAGQQLLQAQGLNPTAAVPTLDESRDTYCQSLLPLEEQGEPLKNACSFALTVSQNMPNFVCEMSVEKYEDITRTFRSTHPMQKIHSHARYVNGKDYYDDLRINGKPAVSTDPLVEGTWTFGEFGAKLLAAFSPANHPAFKFVRSTKVNGTESFEYDFHVEHQNNRFWRWRFGKKATLPGYEGRLWIAKRDGMILRLHINSTQGVPDDFPIQSVESTTDYSYVDFRDKSGFVLPSKVQIRTRMLDHRLYRTGIEFSHCQRFRVDSHISAEVPSQP